MTEPVSLELAKQQCRVVDADTDFDDLIESYIPAAREYVEKETGCILVQRTVSERRDCFGSYVELSYRPVVSVDDVGYLDADGTAQTYADFVAQADRDPARVYPAIGGQFPTLSAYGGVTVTYTAGFVAGEEPPSLIQAMLLLIGHWFANREAVNIGTEVPNEVQLAVESLCGKFWRPVA